jgi:hypothetical protein
MSWHPTPEEHPMTDQYDETSTRLHETTDAQVWAAIETGRAAAMRNEGYGRCGDFVRVGSAAFEEEAQKRDASIARIIEEQNATNDPLRPGN